MSADPTVSVVLIFFDDERFLPEAIDSVFAQSFTDWELILADDGSTDGSTAIARRTAEGYPDRVRYVDHVGHANRGPSATRNLGVEAARGRYVAVLDSDDVWEPDKLAEQVAILDAHPEVGLVVGTSRYWWSWAGDDATCSDKPMPIGAPPERVHQPPELALLLYPLGSGVAPCPSSWLLRREVIDRVGGWEEHIHPIYEDQGFLGKAYLETAVWVSSRCWDRYRRHPGQLMSVTDAETHRQARCSYLAWYEEHLRRRRTRDPRIWRALRRARWPYRHPRLAAVRSAAGRLRSRVRRGLVVSTRTGTSAPRLRGGGSAAGQPPAPPAPTIAFVMWGDLFEDFHDTISVSLERFRSEYSGTWLFGYVDALAAAGVGTTLFHVSARVRTTVRFVHGPSGARVVILPAPRRHRWLRSLYRRSRTRKSLSSLASYNSIPLVRMSRELRASGAEAILTQEYEHARFDVAVVLGKLLRLPVYASFQGGSRPSSRLERLVRPSTVRASAGLIIGSSGERDRVQATYHVPSDRLAAIPNAVDVRSLEPMSRSEARRRLGIRETARVVGWHGRIMIHRKGLDVLLDAWERVCRDRPDHGLLLLLVGTGDDAQAFAHRIDALDRDSIRWRDEYVADRVELLVYQMAADVFVLPSRHEGFPVAPIEAMALGIPVVAAEAPGVTDILPDGERSGGIVVPTEDAAALAAALGRLLDDAALRDLVGERGRQRVERTYSLETVGDQLAAFLFGRTGTRAGART
jgi:glycosyltransferase involved in cell wall biosynthesis